jgi:hypothetical protein
MDDALDELAWRNAMEAEMEAIRNNNTWISPFCLPVIAP